MRVVVPFGSDRPKTRLDPVLDATERVAFARAMLRDVLSALRSLDREPTVLADAPVDVDIGAPVVVDERPLTEAVNAVLPSSSGDEPVAVVMADLALATPDALARLFEGGAADRDADGNANADGDANAETRTGTTPDVVLAPGRGGGTNALLVRDPAFRVDYHGASVRDHRRIAGQATLDVAEVDSFRLATDIDEPADLAEVLLHAPPDAEALAWLEAAGFELVVSDGRTGARR